MHINNKEVAPNTKESENSGYSFPILTLWMIYAGLMIVIAYIPVIWGRITIHIVYLLFIVTFFRTAFSDTDFNKAKKTNTELSFSTWKLNHLLFIVLIPLIVWIGLMTMHGWRF